VGTNHRPDEGGGDLDLVFGPLHFQAAGREHAGRPLRQVFGPLSRRGFWTTKPRTAVRRWWNKGVVGWEALFRRLSTRLACPAGPEVEVRVGKGNRGSGRRPGDGRSGGDVGGGASVWGTGGGIQPSTLRGDRGPQAFLFFPGRAEWSSQEGEGGGPGHEHRGGHRRMAWRRGRSR